MFDFIAAALDQLAAGIYAMFVFSAVQGALTVVTVGVLLMTLAAIVIMVTVVYGRPAGRRCLRTVLILLGLLVALAALATLLGWSAAPQGFSTP